MNKRRDGWLFKYNACIRDKVVEEYFNQNFIEKIYGRIQNKNR